MTEKRNIDWVFILASNSKDGAEQIIHYMVDYLLKEGHTCQIIFLFKKNNDYWDGFGNNCKITYLSKKSVYLGYFLLIKKAYTLFKHHEVKYIFSSQTLANGLLGLLKKIGVIKTSMLIARESTSIFRRFKGLKLYMYKSAYLMGYSHIDLIICQTVFMKKQLTESLPKLLKNKTEQILVIPNPINLKEVNQRSNYNLENLPDTDFIVTAGRLIPEKGFDVLIRAFKKLLEDFGHLKLLILGDGPERSNLSLLIEELNLKNEVILVGHVNNVFPYFKKAKLCVVSSIIEGFPNVLLQMMSQNNNVVSTLCAGGIDKIEGVHTCNPSNSNELFIALKKSLEENSFENRRLFDEALEKRSVSNYFKMLLKSINHIEKQKYVR